MCRLKSNLGKALSSLNLTNSVLLHTFSSLGFSAFIRPCSLLVFPVGAREVRGNHAVSRWNGKTAVVCGGSSGLGLAIAEALVAGGIRELVLIARDPDRLEAAIKRLNNVTDRRDDALVISVIRADLADLDSCRRASEELRKLVTEVDILVQAIGVSDRGTIRALARDRLIELIDGNVVTSLHAIQYFSDFLEARRGVIVLIGSLSSLFAPRYLGGYSIAKHALAAVAQQSRLELAERGIHVYLCCPGPIQRSDSGQRYANLEKVDSELPTQAMLPGGGAKVSGLDQEWLASRILDDAGCRRCLSIYPKKAWWLRLISLISQKWGDRILLKKTA